MNQNLVLYMNETVANDPTADFLRFVLLAPVLQFTAKISVIWATYRSLSDRQMHGWRLPHLLSSIGCIYSYVVKICHVLQGIRL